MRFWLLRAGLLLLALWTLPIIAIRARPYDSYEFDVFLMSPGCAVPCFMGVRPGITTKDAAVAALRAHEWVSHVVTGIPIFIGTYGPVAEFPPRWGWTGALPRWIDPEVDGQSWVMNDKIDYLEVRTRLRLGDVRLMLGRPDAEQVGVWDTTQGPVFAYAAWYHRPQLEVVIDGACPIGPLIRYPVTLRLRGTPPQSDIFRQYEDCPL